MRGFYIGRFQPFHDGHRHMIERIVDEVDELVVGIGSADASHTSRNPLTAGERVVMVTKCLADLDVPTYVVPIEDIERNSVWVAHVRSMCPAFDVAYSNNPLVVRLFAEAGVEVRESPMYNREVLEGTELRERMRAGDEWDHLVPDAAAAVLRDVDAIERLRRIASSDANGDGEASEA